MDAPADTYQPPTLPAPTTLPDMLPVEHPASLVDFTRLEASKTAAVHQALEN